MMIFPYDEGSEVLEFGVALLPRNVRVLVRWEKMGHGGRNMLNPVCTLQSNVGSVKKSLQDEKVLASMYACVPKESFTVSMIVGPHLYAKLLKSMNENVGDDQQHVRIVRDQESLGIFWIIIQAKNVRKPKFHVISAQLDVDTLFDEVRARCRRHTIVVLWFNIYNL
jgi:hypothetical protein